jgi:hypothetical protein
MAWGRRHCPHRLEHSGSELFPIVLCTKSAEEPILAERRGFRLGGTGLGHGSVGCSASAILNSWVTLAASSLARKDSAGWGGRTLLKGCCGRKCV